MGEIDVASSMIRHLENEKVRPKMVLDGEMNEKDYRIGCCTGHSQGEEEEGYEEGEEKEEGDEDLPVSEEEV